MNTNEQEHPKTLNWLDWLVMGLLLVFTSYGTAGLVATTTAAGGLELLLRQAAAVGFTDGAILFWHNRRARYHSREQIDLATKALWASVAVVLAFTIVYGIEAVTAEGLQVYNVTVFGATVPLQDVLGFSVALILGLQAAGTLALILYIEQRDSRAVMFIMQREAESEVTRRQLLDFQTAQKAIAPIVGQAQAVAALRRQLSALGYTERETEELVAQAIAKIDDTRAPIPVTEKESVFAPRAAETEKVTGDVFFPKPRKRTN